MDEQSIFLQALDTPAGEPRAAWLDEVCGVGSPLRERIETLLRRHEQADSFLERPAVGLGETVFPDASGDNLAASLEAGLAPAFGEDKAVVIGSAGHSLLNILAHTMDIPRVVLRESEAEGIEPIQRPNSPEIPKLAADSRYQLQGEIARGGMGAIIKGRDTDLGRELAVKVLLAQHKDKPEVIQRFIEEAQISGQLQHPGIAPVYELGQFADNRPFFSMKLVKGETLAKLLAERRNAAEDRGRFIGIFEHVCQTMAYAHTHGVIHRDLKPANIMVGAFGEVQVMDWGLAKVLSAGGVADEKKAHDRDQGQRVIQTQRSKVGSDAARTFGTLGSQTRVGSVMGTPAYMPPEQAHGEIDNLDERVDVFGLGAILCELLTGKPPYVTDDGSQVFDMASRGELADCFVRLDACGAEAELIALTKHCLELEPADRPRDASAVAAKVSQYLESVETKLRETEMAKVATQARAEEAVRRHKLIHAAGTLVTMSLVIGIAASTWQTLRANREARKAEAESRLAQEAEQAARELATSEVAAKSLAQKETQRAKAATELAEEQLKRSESLVYTGKLMLAQTNFETDDGGLARHYLDECQLSLRGWEHRYLWTRINARQTLVGHAGQVSCVAFSPDGKRIVTGSYDRTAKMWDAEKGQPLLTFQGHTATVWSVAFSPDGERIVTGAGEWSASGNLPGEATVWDAATGQVLHDLKGHTAAVSSAVFSPNGQRIVTGSRDGTVRVWEAETGQELLELNTQTSPLHSLVLGPDGQRILTGGIGGAKVWDIETGRQLGALEGEVLSVAFSPDGGRILTGHADKTARVWKAETGQELLVLKGHTTWVGSVAFRPDGRRIVTGAGVKGPPGPGEVKVWDSETGQELLALKGHKDQVWSVAFSPDGQRIVSGGADRTAKVWDAEKGQDVPTLKGHSDFVGGIAFSPDSKRIVTGSGDNTAKVWDTETGKELLTIKMHADAPCNWPIAGVWSVAFSPDGQHIVTGCQDRAAKVWDAKTGQELLALKGHTAAVRGVAFSPDGNRIVTGASEWDRAGPGEAKVWNAETGQQLLAIEHPGGVTSVAFSPEGDRIATGSWDRTAKVWDAETGREIRTLEGHALAVTGVAFSPDGRWIVTCSQDQTAKMWDANTGRQVFALTGHTAAVTSVAFSPDGQRIVTGGDDWTARVWDTAMGQEVLALKSHTSMVWSVAFSPDGQDIATGIAGAGATVKIWHGEKRQEVLVLQGHAATVTSVAFSTDGNRIFAWDTQENVLAWSAADGKPIDPVDPPTAPPPGPALSPDGFRQAVPQGNIIVVTDERPPPQDNVWPLPDTAGRKANDNKQAGLAPRGGPFDLWPYELASRR